MSEDRDFGTIKVEELTVWIISRIPFAVWNTVAARPTAPVAIPNASAAIFGKQRRLMLVMGSERAGGRRTRGALWLCSRPASTSPNIKNTRYSIVEPYYVKRPNREYTDRRSGEQKERRKREPDINKATARCKNESVQGECQGRFSR